MVSEATREVIRSSADDLESETLSFLEEMVRTPSENPPGEYEAIHDLVRGTFEEQGWSCETAWTPVERLRELGIPEEYPRPNILATVSMGSGPTIALNAHLHTVPADPETWSYDPFGAEIDNNRLYGRGATDCTNRIAAYTLAAQIRERNGLFPEATIILAIADDEEAGGKAGPGYVIGSELIEPD
jgi:acetylornithine deacetylase/succinyl-diaminopimelate desuccinylase-like protein